MQKLLESQKTDAWATVRDDSVLYLGADPANGGKMDFEGMMADTSQFLGTKEQSEQSPPHHRSGGSARWRSGALVESTSSQWSKVAAGLADSRTPRQRVSCFVTRSQNSDHQQICKRHRLKGV